MHRFTLFLSLIVIPLGLFLLRESKLGTFDLIEDGFLNWLIANSETTSPKPADVALFDLRDSTSEKRETRELTPMECALFFQAVSKFDPPVVVAEPILRWQPSDPETEQMLLQRALRLPRLITSSILSDDPPPESDEASLPPGITAIRNVKGETDAVPEFRSVRAEAFEELMLASSRGIANAATRGHTSEFRIPVVLRFRGELIPSILLQSLISWKKSTPSDVEVEMGKAVRIGNSVTIPIDTAGCLTVNGALRNIVPHYSVDDMLLAAELSDSGGKLEIPEQTLRSGITIFGAAESKQQNDVVSGSFLATAIATVQTGLFVRSVPEWTPYLLILGVAVWSLSLRNSGPMLSVLYAIATLGIYALISGWVFGSTQLRMPFAIPAILIFVVTLIRMVAVRGKR